jgi:hypothetical protein
VDTSLSRIFTHNTTYNIMLTQLWPDIKASIIGGEIAEKEKEKEEV